MKGRTGQEREVGIGKKLEGERRQLYNKEDKHNERFINAHT